MYKRYAQDLYSDLHDHTTDDADYAHDTSGEKYNRISRDHHMELLNAKLNARPSRYTGGKAKTRSQTISSIYRSNKKNNSSFVNKLNLAIHNNTLAEDSYGEDLLRNHTTLGGTLDFTIGSTHRGPLDSVTYALYTQEREPAPFMSGTLNYTDSSNSFDIGIYEKLKPLLNATTTQQSAYHLQAENDELREHIRRLSLKIANVGKNKAFGNTISSQKLVSTVNLTARPNALQDEMDDTCHDYQIAMDEYNYYLNRLKQMGDPMYRKELEDRKQKIIDETNTIRKLVKNTMKKADRQEKDLHAIQEGKKYPEIMKEVNIKQTEINKIQRKLDTLRKKNREFEREREVKEEREKELVDRYEGLLYMEGYYRGASVERIDRQEKKYEEMRSKRGGSVVRSSNDTADGYMKQIEDTKQKYARQQITAEIESLALNIKQEREHLNQLEEIAREQRQMIYSMIEAEKSVEPIELKVNSQIKLKKESLTPPKQEKTQMKEYALQILREDSLEDKEGNSERSARKSESSESMEGSRAMTESMKNHIRIRKVGISSPKKETVEQKGQIKEEVMAVKTGEEKVLRREVPLKVEQGITEKYSQGKLKLIQIKDEKIETIDTATSFERREADTDMEVIQNKVETIDMATSYDETEEVIVKKIETIDRATSYEERGANVSVELNLSEVREKSQKARQSPELETSREIAVVNLSTRDELKDEKEPSVVSDQEKLEAFDLDRSERRESPRKEAVVSMNQSIASSKAKEDSMQIVELELIEKEDRQEEIVQPVSIEETILEEKIESESEIKPAQKKEFAEPTIIIQDQKEVVLDQEMSKEISTKPNLFKKSPEKKLKMPVIPELVKESSLEKDAPVNASGSLEYIKEVEVQEVLKTQEEVVVGEEAAERSEEGVTREPEVLVLPECVLKTKKSLFADNNDAEVYAENKETCKEEGKTIVGLEDGAVSEQQNDEIEGSSTTKSQTKIFMSGPVDRMNTIRRGNNDITPKNEVTLSKQNSQTQSEMSSSQSRMKIKPFVMPARKLVISKTKRPQLVDKQDGMAALKRISEAHSDPFTELSSSQYMVSENSSMLMQESILVRPGKVSIAVGTDDVFAGTGKLVENLNLGKEKGIRELALDFERKIRDKAMGKEITRPLVAVTSHGNEAMCQTEW